MRQLLLKLGYQFAFDKRERRANEPRKPKFDYGSTKMEILEDNDERMMRKSFGKWFAKNDLNVGKLTKIH